MRGEVFAYKGAKRARGHEQDGRRYAVVVQSDDVPLSTWIVALTSTAAAGPLRPVVSVDGQDTKVMVDQLVAVDPQSRLGQRVGQLSHNEMAAVDDALRLVLALD